MPTCATCAGSRVPARSPPPATARTARRCSPTASSLASRALQARCRPSPCGRLSRPRTTTTAPPHPAALSGHRALAPRGRPRDGSHVHCRTVDGTGARLSPCGQVVTLTQPHATHRRQRGVLAADGQALTKSLRTRAPLRRPTSIGLESGGVLREFDHRFTHVAPLRLACRARAIRWCPHGPALSGLLPSSPAAPGSNCPQLLQAAATAQRRGLSPRPIRQRLVAHDLDLHQLRRHSAHAVADHVHMLVGDTFLTTSSIVILSRPAIAGLLSRRTLRSPTSDERRGGRNYEPADAVIHHATGRDPALGPSAYRSPLESSSGPYRRRRHCSDRDELR